VLSVCPDRVRLAVTLAVLVNWPTACGVTVILTIAAAPFATEPRLQLTVVVPLQLPWVGLAEPNDGPHRQRIIKNYVRGR